MTQGVSNFFHYFSYNFEKLGLKKLIANGYKNQNMDQFSENKSERAKLIVEHNATPQETPVIDDTPDEIPF